MDPYTLAAASSLAWPPAPFAYQPDCLLIVYRYECAGPCSAPESKYDLDGYNFAPTRSERARQGPCVLVLYEQTAKLRVSAGTV